jgi:HSP20 family molecular chaperone IbpA
VDIREEGDLILLDANMPGVDQESVDVSVENGVLTIEGRARIDAPQGCTLVGQEYGVGRYRRDFTLSDAVDAEGIKARVRQGVLELTLPKHDKVKTRRIKIES